MKQKISVAYSPDTDDAFMVLAMREGLVDTGDYDFSFVTADIQELNQRAKDGTYDVTAISIAAYPCLSKDYLMMPVGASIGDGFGPAIIASKKSGINSTDELTGRKIAVPGYETSAFYAARGLFGDFDEKPMSFLEIQNAVETNQVDAGILIHELQIDCERHGLLKLGDLGTLWKEKYDLPLPLGANAIKRSLGRPTIDEVTKILRDSIVAGLSNRKETLKRALSQAKADLDPKLGDKYITMYVNDDSLEISDSVRSAIDVMFKIGADCGLCDPINVEDHIFRERKRH